MIEQFFNMDGYGFYVWSAWGLSIAGLGLMAFSALSTQHKLQARILQQARRQDRLAKVKAS